MSSQPPSLAAAVAMPVVATASASASSTSPQLPSPSSSSPPHSSSSSDTVTCAPSASSPSPGTASAHDTHHRAKVLERLVLNGKPFTSIQARAHSKKVLHASPSTSIRPIAQRQKTTAIQDKTIPVKTSLAAQCPAFQVPRPCSSSYPASSHFIAPYTLPFSFSVFSATICGQQLVSTTSSMSLPYKHPSSSPSETCISWY